jgi:hypothetical protein
LPFNGTLLAADGHPEVIEGQTDVEKVMLMSTGTPSLRGRNRQNTVEFRQTGMSAQKPSSCSSREYRIDVENY